MESNKRRKLSLAIAGAAAAAGIIGLSVWLMNGSDEGDTVKQQPKTDVVAKKADLAVDGNALRIQSEKGELIYEAVRPDVLKVQFVPKGATPNESQVLQPVTAEGKVEIDTKADPITIRTDEMNVEIDLKTYEFKLLDKDNKLLVHNQALSSENTANLQLGYEGEDTFYGVSGFKASESSDALMVREGGLAITASAQGGGGGPLIWSTDGYGVLLDTTLGMLWAGDQELTYDRLTEPDLEYYVMVGEPKEIMQTTADLTGKPPMFPKWAMGFFNFEWGIDQKELVELVDTYRKKGIPIDNFTLDFDWKDWSADQYGEFRWNPQKFPDGPTGKLKEMMDAKGIKIAGIMKPRIHVDTEQGQYAEEHGFWWPNKRPYSDYFSKQKVNDVNFALPDVRKWYWAHVKDAFDTGIVGWWNDEADEGYDSVQFMNMQRALYDGQRESSNLRVWSINRNFFLGGQRYAYSLWSGDIGTGFGNMAAQRERMLSAVNFGQMKWGMDTGGFHGTPNSENYARWMQFSAFTPVFRVHGTQHEQRQPWVYGEVAEKAAKEAILLRYRLLPYIYAYERQAFETGLGLVKPLLYDYPKDPQLANHVDSWMFGDYLLVSPVVEEGQTTKSIYLPQGTWIDYFKGTVYEGGKTIEYTVNDKTWEDIPLFIKAGAIIPSQEAQNYVGEKQVEELFIDVFPSEEATSFNLYDDDGSTYDYEKEVFFKQLITAKKNGAGADVEFSDVSGSYKPSYKTVVLRIHGTASKNIEVAGQAVKELGAAEFAASKEVSFSSQKDIYGDAVYVRVPVGEKVVVSVK